jgi:capsular polysaccharide biosynthesis protein
MREKFMEKDEIEIDLRELFYCLLGNIVNIILATLVGGLLLYLYSTLALSKEYQSSTSFYVLNRQENQTITSSDLQTGTQLSKDYAAMVQSRTVMAQAIAELDLQNQYSDMAGITPDQLSAKISVAIVTDTRIVKITVTDTNPTRAQDIANAVREAAAKHIYEVMDIEAVNVVDYANLPEGASAPNVKKYTLLGAVAGFVLACAITIIVYLADDTIKTPDDVERYLGLSVLASIPYDESLDTGNGSKGKRGSRGQKKAGATSGGAASREPVKAKSSTAKES